MTVHVQHATVVTLSRFFARLFMWLTAAILFASGYSLLTAPEMVPVTVGIWLAAAAVVGVSLVGPLPRE